MSGNDMRIVLSWWNIIGNCPVVYKCPEVNPWVSCFTRCSRRPTLDLSCYINRCFSYLTSFHASFYLTSFHATCAGHIGARFIFPRCNYLTPTLRRQSWLHWYNTSICCIYVKCLKRQEITSVRFLTADSERSTAAGRRASGVVVVV